MVEEQQKIEQSTAVIQKVTEPEAFEIYLSMGVERSLAKVWELLGARSVALRTLEDWSSKNNWVIRCDEYDKKMHDEIMKIVLKKAVRSKADVVEICRAVLARFSQRLLGEEIAVATKSGIQKVMERYNPDMADAERAYNIIKREIGEGLPEWGDIKEINLTQIFQQIIAKSQNDRKPNGSNVDIRPAE